MSSNLTELTLEKSKINNWILLSVKVEVIPEFSDSLIQETDGSLIDTRS
jgi:hypothetical protein